MIEEETFFAWLDGELSPEEAARVEAEIAADPELSSRAATHRAMTSGLRGTFGNIETAPVPDRLKAMLEKDDNVVSLDDARATRGAGQTQPFWVQAATLAATLAIGVFAGSQLGSRPAGPIQAKGGRLVASADLDHTLTTQLASASTGPGSPIGLTYRNKSGAICRTFNDTSASGLACREGGDWRILGLFQASKNRTSEYRMAAEPDPRLLEMVDETIEGEPFDAAQERSAQAREWH